MCLVGESGSGKSVTALSIARLLASPPAHYRGGEILLEGRDALRASRRELRELRGGVVSYIFQDPASSLNPVRRVGGQIKESLRLHRPGAATDAEAARLLKQAGIPAAERQSVAAAMPSVATVSPGPAKRRCSMPVERSIQSGSAPTMGASSALSTTREGSADPNARR